MFKRILVPLDGSLLAEQALPLAARIARASGSTLLLVRAINMLAESNRIYMAEPALFLPDMQEEEKQNASYYLLQMLNRTELKGIDVRTMIREGHAATIIMDVAREEQASLIVMSSHGYSGVKRWMLGSTTQTILRQSPIPVLIVREPEHKNMETTSSQDHPIHALVALDGSEFSETIIQPAAQMVAALAGREPGTLHLLQLLTPFTSPEELTTGKEAPEISMETRLVQAEEYLKTIKQRVETLLQGVPNIKVTCYVGTCNDIASSLVNIASSGDGTDTNRPYDLIAVSTHGRTGMQHLLMGSVAEHILHTSQLPLLVVRPSQEALERMAAEEVHISKALQVSTNKALQKMADNLECEIVRSQF